MYAELGGLPQDVDLDSAGDVIVTGAHACAAKHDGATGEILWEAACSHSPATAGVDGAGDVFVSGGRVLSGSGSPPFLAKFDGTTGTEIWSFTGSVRGRDVQFDGVGNPVVVGHSPADLEVAKYDSATGAEIWAYAASGTANAGLPPARVVFDAAGDVIVSGTLLKGGTDEDFVVVKLDGSTGAEIWRRDIDGSAPDDESWALTLDGTGNPVVLGRVGSQFFVAKLDGVTGADVWTYFGASTHFVFWGGNVAVDPTGDVVATGTARPLGSDSILVVKLDGATGGELWTESVLGTAPTSSGRSLDMAIDAAGDVLLAGRVHNEDTSWDGIVAKLDGATGDQEWRQEFRGGFEPSGTADIVWRLTLTPSGDAVVGGRYETEKDGIIAFVARLDNARGAIGSRFGQSLAFKDKGPDKRTVRFTIKDDFVFVPVPASGADPTVAGAVVRVINDATGEEATMLAPGGAGWKAIGNPPGAKGYKYRAPTGAGPCRSILVKPRKVKVVCTSKQVAIPFDLDEPSQGSLSVSVQLGNAGAQCATFGGLVIQDEPGTFKGRKSPAGPACP